MIFLNGVISCSVVCVPVLELDFERDKYNCVVIKLVFVTVKIVFHIVVLGKGNIQMTQNYKTLLTDVINVRVLHIQSLLLRSMS